MDNTGDEIAMAPEALRETILSGLALFDDFANGISKHPKTLRRMRPPVVYIGRTPYVPIELGRQWILDGCPPVLPAAPKRRGAR